MENLNGITIVKKKKQNQQKAWGIFRGDPTDANYIACKKAKIEAKRV